MKNFLYTTSIFLLLLSPATCNYDSVEEADNAVSGTQTITVETSESTIDVEVNVDVLYDQYGQPIIKPTKP